ncbi:hypothetical protein ACQ4PT_068558 [Festuca glaucescens]
MRSHGPAARYVARFRKLGHRNKREAGKPGPGGRGSPDCRMHGARPHRPVFKKFGVEKFDPLNEKFDPERHYAIFQMPDTSKPAGTVAAVVKVPYTLNQPLRYSTNIFQRFDFSSSTPQENDKEVSQTKDQESTAQEASKEDSGSPGGTEDLDLSKEELVKLVLEKLRSTDTSKSAVSAYNTPPILRYPDTRVIHVSQEYRLFRF